MPVQKKSENLLKVPPQEMDKINLVQILVDGFCI